MILTPEERALEAQQNITRNKTKALSIGTTKLAVDPTECPSCRQIKLACKCAGSAGGKKEGDDQQAKNQDQTNSYQTNARINPQLTPFKLVLIPGEKKVPKEHLENDELYEIQEGKTPQHVLAFFNAYLNRLAATQNKTFADLTKEGFSGKIEAGVVTLNFPNENEREKFSQIASDPKIGLIKQTLLNSNNSNSVAQQMVARMISPQNRRVQS